MNLSGDTLVLSARHPVGLLSYRGDVEKLVPGAKRIVLQGQDVLAIPHKPDAVTVLRNLGVEAPSPILRRYDWGGNTPFNAQRVTAALLSESPNAFVLNEMATGKTRAALFAFDYLREQGMAKRMLVVAPLSTIKHTWLNEIARHMGHLTAELLRGRAHEVRLQLANYRSDIAIINHDRVTYREAELLSHKWDVVCIDELTAFKNATASRSKAMRRVIAPARYKWGMTGTPTPQGPQDAYGQIKLINPVNMSMPFRQWENIVTEKVGPFKRVPRKNAKQEVFQRMQPAVRFKRSDVVELPPVQTLWRQAPMSAVQERVYKELSSKMKTQVSEGTITAANAGVKMMKLLQVASGFVYVDGKTAPLKPTGRLETIVSAVEEAHAKFLVFTPFTAGVDLIHAALTKEGLDVEAVDGRVSSAKRNRIFDRFSNDPDMAGIVAHPRTMSHGLNLTEADVVVWSSPYPSLEIYQQANARISRPGQKRKQLIIHITSTFVENRIYKVLHANESLQNSLLELFKLDT